MVTPEARACLDYAFRVVFGWGADDERYVFQDGVTFASSLGLESISPSGFALEAMTHLVAKAMELHLSGVDFAKIHEDLLASDLGLLADKVDYHLRDVSVYEWVRLRERVAFYALDNNTPSVVQSTEIEGEI